MVARQVREGAFRLVPVADSLLDLGAVALQAREADSRPVPAAAVQLDPDQARTNGTGRTLHAGRRKAFAVCFASLGILCFAWPAAQLAGAEEAARHHSKHAGTSSHCRFLAIGESLICTCDALAWQPRGVPCLTLRNAWPPGMHLLMSCAW